jgi:hypothetical protein
VQVSEQILQFLCVQLLAIAGHLIAPEANDIAHPLIIRGQAAQGKILSLEHSLESGTLLAASRVGLVAAGALGIKDLSASRLLRIQPKLRIGFTPLDVTRHTGGEYPDQQHKTEQNVLFISQLFAILASHSRHPSRFTMIEQEVAALWQ